MTTASSFFKGLRSAYRNGYEILDSEVEGSIYYWWWRYLRISPVLWYANKTGRSPVDPAIKKVFEECGQLYRGDFSDWWSKNCERLFAEPLGRKELRVMRPREAEMQRFDKDSVVIEVPLSIPVERLHESFRNLIAQLHPGRHMNLASTSQAAWRLKTMRYRIHVIEVQYWSILYKSLYPHLAAVRIGDRLQVAPHLKVRGTDWMQNQARYNRLNSIAGRHLYKGRFTLLNAERGSFPNSTAIAIPDGHMPFGKRHNADYFVATNDMDGSISPWRKWLRRQFDPDLRDYVFWKNQGYLSDSIVRETDKKFISFYRGESDLLS